MGHKPTLGGLKRAQDFLSLRGFPLPTVKVNVRLNRILLNDLRWDATRTRSISLSNVIAKRGPMYEIVNVGLVSEYGDRFLLFVSNAYVPPYLAKQSRGRGWDTFLFISRGDHRFVDFVNSEEDGAILVNLVRWGKPEVTMRDRIRFRLSPGVYATEVFPELARR